MTIYKASMKKQDPMSTLPANDYAKVVKFLQSSIFETRIENN